MKGDNLNPNIRALLKYLQKYNIKMPSEAGDTSGNVTRVHDQRDLIHLLAASFQANRGKRLNFNKILALARGFQANRGKK